jgi:hemerythrin superfamily protein
MVDNINALEILRAQHDEIDHLIAALEACDDEDDRVDLFEELADQLAAHAAMEETLFYPWVLAKQTEGILRESTEEHLAIKRVLADMLTLDPSDDEFAAKLAVMKEEIRHHAHDEEEGELFPKVKRMASEAELEMMGCEMLDLLEQILCSEPRHQAFAESSPAMMF